MKRLLVTGASGQLGRSLKKVLERSPPELSPMFVTRKELDLTSPQQMTMFFNQHGRFDVIVNLAAYTQVDRAESERDLAWRVNAEAPAEMIQHCDRFIHISTDYVFDGEKREPYVEDDSTNPLNVYGESKRAGEVRLLESGRALILRTSWLYSEFGGNFLTNITRLAKERDRLQVVNDQRGTPTYAGDLAAFLAAHAIPASIVGLFHFANEGEATWFEFAQYFLSRQEIQTPVEPITTAQYPTAARRPSYSVMSKARVREAFDPPLRSWQEAADECLMKISDDSANMFYQS